MIYCNVSDVITLRHRCSGRLKIYLPSKVQPVAISSSKKHIISLDPWFTRTPTPKVSMVWVAAVWAAWAAWVVWDWRSC